MAMHRVLVSACLLGERVRHNGAHKRCDDDILLRWQREGRVVAVCPEVAGGLPVPRPAAEIERGAGGERVLQGAARVIDDGGRDVTKHFVAGAEHALRIAREHGIRIAVLKARSPSCGTLAVYDGTFTGKTAPGDGVTAALLQRAGVQVFDEERLAAADALLQQLDRDAQRGVRTGPC